MKMKELKTILNEYDNKIDELFTKYDYNVQEILGNAEKHLELLNEFTTLTNDHNQLIKDHNMLLDSYHTLLNKYHDLLTDRINSKGNEND